jgi:hypothetical protein
VKAWIFSEAVSEPPDPLGGGTKVVDHICQPHHPHEAWKSHRPLHEILSSNIQEQFLEMAVPKVSRLRKGAGVRITLKAD